MLFRCKNLGDHRIAVAFGRFELRCGGNDLYILEIEVIGLLPILVDVLHLLRGVSVGVDVDFVVLLSQLDRR